MSHGAAQACPSRNPALARAPATSRGAIILASNATSAVKVRRFDAWPTLLDQFIQSRRTSAFEWGVHDCCLFAADAVRAMTGVDLAAGYRGAYSDSQGAAKILSGRAAGDLFSETAERFGLKEIVPAHKYAGRGDVVMIDQRAALEIMWQLDEQDELCGTEGTSLAALGVVGLSGTDIWAPGEFTLMRLPIELAARCWKI